MTISHIKRRLVVSFATGAILIAAILATLNIISDFVYLRLDFSQGKIYSISKATKKTLLSLEDPVIIELYYSKKLPLQIMVMKDYFADISKEYCRASKGKVKFSLIEIEPTKQGKQNAVRKGIIPVRFDVYSKERFEATEGFFGVVFKYREDKKVIPFVSSVEGLEYLLTSKIISLTAKIKPKIGFVTGFDCIDINRLPGTFRQQLEEKYELESVDLNASTLPGIKTLLFLGPQQKIPQENLLTLDKYLLSGSNLLVALDTHKINPQIFTAEKNETNLENFLLHHGIKIEPEMILDIQSQSIQVTQRKGMYLFANIVKYPAFVTVNDLNRENPVTRQITSLILPFVSPLEITKKSVLKSQVLAKSSSKSWLIASEGKKLLSINPFDKLTPSQESPKGPFDLITYLEDNFTHFDTNDSKTALKSRLMVVGTSKFISPDYRMPDENYLFFANVIDWISQSEELISVRSKTAKFVPLVEISLVKKIFVKYSNILLPPFMAIFLGFVLWQVNTKRKNKYKKLLLSDKK